MFRYTVKLLPNRQKKNNIDEGLTFNYEAKTENI